MIPDKIEISITDKINNTIINLNRVDHTKYLGIFIDQFLRWDRHITELLKKTRFIIFLFHKLKYILSSDQLKVMYYASYHSIISYGILGWGGANDTLIKLIQNVQYRLFKFLNRNLNKDNNNDNEHTILNVKQTFYFFAIKKEVIKLYNSLLEKNDNNLDTNRNNLLNIPKKNKATGQKCYSFIAFKIFNALPKKLKNLGNPSRITQSWINSFKKWLSKFFIVDLS